MSNRQLCRALIQAESEQDAIRILRNDGLWDDPDCWKPLGGNSNNLGTILNQQASKEGALAEKITNSIDAVLTRYCLLQGNNPEASYMSNGQSMPSNPFDAAKQFDLFWKFPKARNDLTAHAEKISVIVTGATGKKPACISIVDQGEGQSPDKFADTFCSLHRSNKNKIAFVQGRYNMGGTGVLRFCGNEGMQLVVSRRDPQLGGDGEWGFTVFRKMPPAEGERNHYWVYLVAPQLGLDGTSPGEVLRFKADSCKLLPKKNTEDEYQRAWARPLEHGTLVKLYDYMESRQSATDTRGTGNSISLLAKLEIELVDPALPFRLHECRFPDSAGDTSRNCIGLMNRYKVHQALERGFPFSGYITSPSEESFPGEYATVTTYAFTVGDDGTSTGGRRRPAEYGIVFVLNGQAHAGWNSRFFTRENVNLSGLEKDLMVVVDCSMFSAEAINDLFTAGRDRMVKGSSLYRWLEREIKEHLGKNQTLRNLHQNRLDARRKQLQGVHQEVTAQIVRDLIESSSGLANYLGGGGFPATGGPSGSGETVTLKDFVGRNPPTYFKLRGKNKQNAQVGKPCSVNFKTDAQNSYFDRSSHEMTLDNKPVDIIYSSLQDGKATIKFELPPEVAPGQQIAAKFITQGRNLAKSFVNDLTIVIIDSKPPQPPGGKPTDNRSSGFDLPMPPRNQTKRVEER